MSRRISAKNCDLQFKYAAEIDKGSADSTFEIRTTSIPTPKFYQQQLADSEFSSEFNFPIQMRVVKPVQGKKTFLSYSRAFAEEKAKATIKRDDFRNRAAAFFAQSAVMSLIGGNHSPGLLQELQASRKEIELEFEDSVLTQIAIIPGLLDKILGLFQATATITLQALQNLFLKKTQQTREEVVQSSIDLHEKDVDLSRFNAQILAIEKHVTTVAITTCGYVARGSVSKNFISYGIGRAFLATVGYYMADQIAHMPIHLQMRKESYYLLALQQSPEAFLRIRQDTTLRAEIDGEISKINEIKQSAAAQIKLSPDQLTVEGIAQANDRYCQQVNHAIEEAAEKIGELGRSIQVTEQRRVQRAKWWFGIGKFVNWMRSGEKKQIEADQARLTIANLKFSTATKVRENNIFQFAASNFSKYQQQLFPKPPAQRPKRLSMSSLNSLRVSLSLLEKNGDYSTALKQFASKVKEDILFELNVDSDFSATRVAMMLYILPNAYRAEIAQAMVGVIATAQSGEAALQALRRIYATQDFDLGHAEKIPGVEQYANVNVMVGQKETPFGEFLAFRLFKLLEEKLNTNPGSFDESDLKELKGAVHTLLASQQYQQYAANFIVDLQNALLGDINETQSLSDTQRKLYFALLSPNSSSEDQRMLRAQKNLAQAVADRIIAAGNVQQASSSLPYQAVLILHAKFKSAGVQMYGDVEIALPSGVRYPFLKGLLSNHASYAEFMRQNREYHEAAQEVVEQLLPELFVPDSGLLLTVRKDTRGSAQYTSRLRDSALAAYDAKQLDQKRSATVEAIRLKIVDLLQLDSPYRDWLITNLVDKAKQAILDDLDKPNLSQSQRAALLALFATSELPVLQEARKEIVRAIAGMCEMSLDLELLEAYQKIFDDTGASTNVGDYAYEIITINSRRLELAEYLRERLAYVRGVRQKVQSSRENLLILQEFSEDNLHGYDYTTMQRLAAFYMDLCHFRATSPYDQMLREADQVIATLGNIAIRVIRQLSDAVIKDDSARIMALQAILRNVLPFFTNEAAQKSEKVRLFRSQILRTVKEEYDHIYQYQPIRLTLVDKLKFLASFHANIFPTKDAAVWPSAELGDDVPADLLQVLAKYHKHLRLLKQRQASASRADSVASEVSSLVGDLTSASPWRARQTASLDAEQLETARELVTTKVTQEYEATVVELTGEGLSEEDSQQIAADLLKHDFLNLASATIREFALLLGMPKQELDRRLKQETQNPLQNLASIIKEAGKSFAQRVHMIDNKSETVRRLLVSIYLLMEFKKAHQNKPQFAEVGVQLFSALEDAIKSNINFVTQFVYELEGSGLQIFYEMLDSNKELADLFAGTVEGGGESRYVSHGLTEERHENAAVQEFFGDSGKSSSIMLLHQILQKVVNDLNNLAFGIGDGVDVEVLNQQIKFLNENLGRIYLLNDGHHDSDQVETLFYEIVLPVFGTSHHSIFDGFLKHLDRQNQEISDRHLEPDEPKMSVVELSTLGLGSIAQQLERFIPKAKPIKRFLQERVREFLSEYIELLSDPADNARLSDYLMQNDADLLRLTKGLDEAETSRDDLKLRIKKLQQEIQIIRKQRSGFFGSIKGTVESTANGAEDPLLLKQAELKRLAQQQFYLDGQVRSYASSIANLSLQKIGVIRAIHEVSKGNKFSTMLLELDDACFDALAMSAEYKSEQAILWRDLNQLRQNARLKQCMQQLKRRVSQLLASGGEGHIGYQDMLDILRCLPNEFVAFMAQHELLMDQQEAVQEVRQKLAEVKFQIGQFVPANLARIFLHDLVMSEGESAFAGLSQPDFMQFILLMDNDVSAAYIQLSSDSDSLPSAYREKGLPEDLSAMRKKSPDQARHSSATGNMMSLMPARTAAISTGMAYRRGHCEDDNLTIVGERLKVGHDHTSKIMTTDFLRA